MSMFYLTVGSSILYAVPEILPTAIERLAGKTAVAKAGTAVSARL
jgi:hypothetical protein